MVAKPPSSVPAAQPVAPQVTAFGGSCPMFRLFRGHTKGSFLPGPPFLKLPNILPDDPILPCSSKRLCEETCCFGGIPLKAKAASNTRPLQRAEKQVTYSDLDIPMDKLTNSDIDVQMDKLTNSDMDTQTDNVTQ
ncbi:hypothetical protein P7K49_032260 [Saguinus oedipus]|uniref:Uncharacterized protein n=1 Tax=Saguinus oedipus TaxID=9490 RepID=A0ABQ9TXS3_SAGOE|nr:hypothetical protein P7K49_032260 [Saguinus oedipus]